MDWPGIIAGLFAIGIGIVNKFFPAKLAELDRAFGRLPSTESVCRRFGEVLIVGGIFLILFFSFFSSSDR